MKDILIFKIWQHKVSALAAASTIAIVFLWPSLPLRGIDNWLRFFVYYSPQNYFYFLLSLLSGLYVGIYVYNKKVAPCCNLSNAKVGTSGSLFGALLGACPACIPALPFLLPLSVTIVLSRLSLLFLLAAVGLMLWTVHKMNGFRKVSNATS